MDRIFKHPQKITTNHLLNSLGSSFGAVLMALLVGAALILISGSNPFTAYGALFVGAFGSLNGWAETLVKASPLLLTSLGVAVAFRCNLFNVGAEGQIYIGALCASLVGLSGINITPFLAIPLVLLAGAAGGAIWGAIPGFLKARFGLDEIINTIMFNYLATLFVSFLVRNTLKDPTGYIPHSALFAADTNLPIIIPGTRLHAGLIIALLAVFGVYIFLWKTRIGFEMRMVGLNARSALASGIHIQFLIVLAMAISGGLSGIGGMVEVTGVHHRLIEQISPGYGFTAIAISLLGANHPFGILAAAILFAGLDVGASSMQARVGVPMYVVEVIQGLVILFVVARAIFERFPSFVKRFQLKRN